MHKFWITFVRHAILLWGIGISSADLSPSLFSDSSIIIAEAPTSQQFVLNQNAHSRPTRARARTNPLEGKSKVTLNTVSSGVYPVINVTWGGKEPQQFVSYVDTGSSDTWAVANNYQCLNPATQAPEPQSFCDFGALYNPTLGSFENITSEYYSIQYFPENNTLYGSMGYAPISIGGLTVPKAEVAEITTSAFAGDKITSGLLGLAYPPIVAAYFRSNQSQALYDPIFTTMVKEGIVKEAVFSLAIDRVPQNYSSLAPAGQLAIGGLVSSDYYYPPFTSVPIEVTTLYEEFISNLTFYSTTVEFIYSLQNGTITSGGTFQTIVDSGTSPNFVPTTAADSLNAQFSPPAVFNASLGYWTVECSAKPPYAAYIIGGKTMPMDPRDMIVPDLNGLLGFENVCFSAFADGGSADEGLQIIGNVWQRSYVVAYDQGRGMLHFASRVPY